MFGAVALVAGMALSSCASDDDTVVVKEVSNVQLGKTLTVKSNVEATFTFDGQTKTGTQAEFNTKAVEGVLTVSAEGYIAQESTVNFGDNSVVSLEINLMEKASNEVAQESAKGTTVYSAANSWGVVAGIEVPAEVAINGSNKSFSIATFERANAIDASKLAVDDELSGSVLSFDLEPKGASFSRPVSLTAAIPAGFDTDFEFVATNGEETVPVKVEGGLLKADVNRFSARPWAFNLIGRVIKVVDGREFTHRVAPFNPTLRPGASVVRIPVRYGFEPYGMYSVERFINDTFRIMGNFLRSLFGTPTTTSYKEVEFEIPGRGTLSFDIYHHYKLITILSNGRPFVIKVYFGLPEIDNIQWTPDHSGGASETDDQEDDDDLV
jgi:hypothetical protein